MISDDNSVLETIKKFNFINVTVSESEKAEITFALKVNVGDDQTPDYVELCRFTIPSVTENKAGLIPAKSEWDSTLKLGSDKPISSGAAYDSKMELLQMGGNIIGTYKEGKLKNKYYNGNLTEVSLNNFSCCYLVCNHQHLKIKYTSSGTDIDACHFVRSINNKVTVYSGKGTAGTYEYSLSAYDLVYLNFGSFLGSNGYEITPEDTWEYNYDELKFISGISIAEIGNKRGFLTISNNAIVVNNLINYTHLILSKSTFDELGIDKIYANIPNQYASYPLVIQVDVENNILQTEYAEGGEHIIELHENADKIYFNYFRVDAPSWHNIFTVKFNGDTTDLNNLISEVDNYEIGTYHRRNDAGVLSGMVNANGTISQNGSFKYKKVSGKYIKGVKYVRTRSTTVPTIVTEKDGVFDCVVPYEQNGIEKADLNYEFDYIYINFFDGTYNDDSIGILLYNDTQHKYSPSLKLSDSLNKPYSFNGKLAWFFGDSITQGHTHLTPGGPQTVTQNGYPKQFSDAVNLNYVNKGSGGETFYRPTGDGNDTLSHLRTAFTPSPATMPDFVFIASGSNDYSNRTSISNFETAVINAFDYLTQVYSGEVIIITPINRIDRRNCKTLSIDEYREVLTKQAIKRKFSVIDGSKFAFPNYKDGLYSYLLSDEAHPTEDGYGYYAKMLRTILC